MIGSRAVRENPLIVYKCRFTLDDNPIKGNRGKVYKDFVDTQPWHPAGLTAEGILKVILGAVHKRRDKMALA